MPLILGIVAHPDEVALGLFTKCAAYSEPTAIPTGLKNSRNSIGTCMIGGPDTDRTVKVKLRHGDFTNLGRSRALPPAQDEMMLYEVALQLLVAEGIGAVLGGL